MTIPDTLDCQDCGEALLDLSPEMAQRVALKPYAYVVYCVRCGQAREREQNGSTSSSDHSITEFGQTGSQTRDTGSPRRCDLCDSDAFLTSALNAKNEPVYLCRDCIYRLARASDNGSSEATR